MIMNVSVNFYLTWKCNLTCNHCQYSCHPKETMEMTDDQIITAMEILKVIFKSTTSRMLVVGISGGEPLLHPRFWQVVESINEFRRLNPNIFPLELHTNGTQPIGDEVISAHPHIFDSAYIGCDAHHDAQKQNLKWQDLSMIAKQVVVRRSMLQSDTSASWLRMIGRAKENFETQEFGGQPKHHCTLSTAANSHALLCFTPERIKFCTEIGRDEYQSHNSEMYPTDVTSDIVKDLLLKSMKYSIYSTGINCLTPCMYKLSR